MLVTPLARALDVGEPVRFAARTTEGDARTVDDYAGQLLIVYFWASWHTPSVAQLDTLSAVAERTAGRGVALLGVCLDDLGQNEAAVRDIIAQSATHDAWDHTFAQTQTPPLDTRFFGEPYEIPACWVVAPDGEALWVGHPAALPEALAGFLETHAPERPEVADVLPEPITEAEGRAMVDGGEVDTGDAGGEGSPGDTEDAAAAAVSAAKAALLEAEDAYAADPPDFAQVLSAMADIDAAAAQDPLIAAHGQRWKRRLDAADPDTLADLVAARDADVAAALALDAFLLTTADVDPLDGRDAASAERLAIKLRGAQRDAERGRHLEAYGDFKWGVVEVAAGTPEADDALVRVLRYEADEELMDAVAAAQAEREAQAKLFLAKGYVQNYNEDEAKVVLRDLIAAYPDSEAAVEAQALLDALP